MAIVHTVTMFCLLKFTCSQSLLAMGLCLSLYKELRPDRVKHHSLHHSSQKRVILPENHNLCFLLIKVTIFYTYNAAKRIRGQINSRYQRLIKFVEIGVPETIRMN